jgi:internalin A
MAAIGCVQRRLLSTDPSVIAYFGDPFRPLEPECKVIQFEKPLTPAHLRQAGALVADRPDVQLYVYLDATRDLDFLQYFPSVRRLQLALYRLDDIGGLAHVAGVLEQLNFGKTKRAFSLRFLESFPRLDDLFLVGHKKHLATVGNLTNLTRLGLSGITLKDLSLLLPLQKLRALAILLGSTRNLSLLPRLASLEELLLMRITQLSDLSVLADLAGLKKLRLDWMRNITHLPSLARQTRLEEVVLDTMKGLADLSSIAAAPGLRELTVGGLPLVTADSFRCFLGHPSLQKLTVYTREEESDAIQRMFPGIAG